MIVRLGPDTENGRATCEVKYDRSISIFCCQNSMFALKILKIVKKLIWKRFPKLII